MSTPERAGAGLAAKFEAIFPHLDERQRRLLIGAEARAVGYGGIRLVARAAGVREGTVSRGLAELEAGAVPLGRVRRIGGGRKRVVDLDAGLRPALLALVEPDMRGDPMSPLRWTTKSTRRLAEALTLTGHRVSADTVADLLREEGFSLQGNAKTIEGKQNPDRDAQFRYINDQVRGHQATGDPVVSVDTKKKELVGSYKNAGREWARVGEPIAVQTHDFPDAQLGKAIPYGVYDPGANTGWVSVGTDHDTAAFAVATIRRWWNAVGRSAYPQARRLLITADAGGSNGYRTRAWKAELAELAADTGLYITVSHFPPGTSKWNCIEHRLFSHITMNWRARPLTSHEVIVGSIAATATRAGLSVRAELDTRAYETGVKISDREMDALPLEAHDWHGEWNYTLCPESPRTAVEQESDSVAPPARPDHAWLTHPVITGMQARTWEDLIARLAVLRHAQREAALHDRRGGARKTAPGTGRKAVLTLADRALATVLHHRFNIPERTAAALFAVSQQSVNKAIRQTDPLLTLAGYRPAPAETRIRTLPELIAYAIRSGLTPPAEIKPAC